MFKSIFWKQSICKLTLLAFTVALVPPSASANNTGIYRTELHEKNSQFKEAQSYLKIGGVEAFIDAYRYELNNEDKQYIRQSLFDPSFPESEVVNSEIRVGSEAQNNLVIIKPINLETGEFRINGLNFKWNDEESMQSNVERLLPLTQVKGFTSYSILDLIFPQAHAFGIMGIGLALGIGVLIWALVKKKKKKNELSKLQDQKNTILKKNYDDCQAQWTSNEVDEKQKLKDQILNLENEIARNSKACKGLTNKVNEVVAKDPVVQDNQAAHAISE